VAPRVDEGDGRDEIRVEAALEMVDLVKQGARQQSGRFVRNRPACQIDAADSHPAGPRHLGHPVRNRQAAFPAELLAVTAFEDRVDQDDRSFGNFDDGHSDGHAQLGRREAKSLGGAHHGQELCDHVSGGPVRDVRLLSGLSESRIGLDEDRAHANQSAG
jgi:hypothetical protein